MVKVREDRSVRTRACYLAIGVTLRHASFTNASRNASSHATAITLNHQLGRPSRALVNYLRLKNRGINHLGVSHIALCHLNHAGAILV